MYTTCAVWKEITAYFRSFATILKQFSFFLQKSKFCESTVLTIEYISDHIQRLQMQSVRCGRRSPPTSAFLPHGKRVGTSWRLHQGAHKKYVVCIVFEYMNTGALECQKVLMGTSLCIGLNLPSPQIGILGVMYLLKNDGTVQFSPNTFRRPWNMITNLYQVPKLINVYYVHTVLVPL